jgi:TonB family protein
MNTMLVLALLLGQFTPETPKYAVVRQAEIRYSVRPELGLCNLVPPFKLAGILTITVNVKGEAQNVHMSRPTGNACVDKQVVQAGTHYRFAPAIKEGHPFQTTVSMNINLAQNK